MLSKLAFRNVRKTVRDYGVYLITMILVTALMFAFHSMMFSPQIKKLATVAGVMEAMIGIAAGFIVLILCRCPPYPHFPAPDFLHFIIKRQPPPPQGPLLPVQTCKSFRTAARKGQILQDGKGCISAVQQYLKNNRRLFFRPCGPSPARGHRDKLFYCGAIKNGLRPLRPIWPSGRGFYCAVITTS